MTGDESKFAFLIKRKGGYVTFGNNAKGRIIGQGNIERENFDDDLGLEISMGNYKLKIEDNKKKL